MDLCLNNRKQGLLQLTNQFNNLHGWYRREECQEYSLPGTMLDRDLHHLTMKPDWLH